MMKMIRLLCLLLTTFLFATQTQAKSTIISANSFETVKQVILQQKDPHHLLLALDDDDTLTMLPCPSPSHCQYLGGPVWYTWQSKLPATSKERIWKTFPELLHIANFLYVSSKSVLVDPAIPDALHAASNQGAHIIVVTDRGYAMTGATEQEFTKDNIFKSIEKSAIETPGDHISYPGFYFPQKWGDHTPRRIAYLHGVLYVAGQNKGVMIQQLLAKTNQTKKIQTIIFVDDTLQNVKDVANAYKNNPHVNVISIHFTRLAAQKAAFLTGKNAKKLQATANQQWYAIRDAMKKNMIGFAF